MPDDFEPLEPSVAAPSSPQPRGPFDPAPVAAPPFGSAAGAPFPAPPPVGPAPPSPHAIARWSPGGTTGPPRRAGFAVAALVLGLCSLVLFLFVVPPVLAIVFGLVGASQIKRSDGRLGGLAFARWGWALGIVGLIAAAAVYAAIAADGGFGDDRRSPTELEVGDCFDDSNLQGLIDGTEFRTDFVETVECVESHDAEVFHVGRLNPGASSPYPGDDEVQDRVQAACYGQPFENYVGRAYEQSRLDVVYYYPEQLSWRISRGAFSCSLVDPTLAPLTGSMRGTDE